MKNLILQISFLFPYKRICNFSILSFLRLVSIPQICRGAALPTNTPGIPCIFDPHGRAGICGDWLLGSSLEAAALSGIALANHASTFYPFFSPLLPFLISPFYHSQFTKIKVVCNHMSTHTVHVFAVPSQLYWFVFTLLLFYVCVHIVFMIIT